MKNLNLNISILNKETVEALISVENEIKELYNNHYLDADLKRYENLDELLEIEFMFADDDYTEEMTEDDILEGEYPKEYYSELFQLKEKREELTSELFNEFVNIFQINKTKSIGLVAKVLGMEEDALLLLLELTMTSTIQKNNKQYIDCANLFNLVMDLEKKETTLYINSDQFSFS